MSEFVAFDPRRVARFLDDFRKPTIHLRTENRRKKLDQRIESASLGLADKAEVLRRLAPRADDHLLAAATGPREELRMERIVLSVAPTDLPWFKFALEYDGDYKDLEEYVFHDIDDAEYRNRILRHLRGSSQQIGVKVLTDVDDTLYANLIDRRYPKRTLYPGVLEFYDAVKKEPFALRRIPITTLSARPNPIAGKLEEGSLRRLAQFTGGRLQPSGLSGALFSSAVGTVETILRANLDLLSDEIPHGQENDIGEVKFKNFSKFSVVYPEYRYVFVGDSGQADAVTAQLMLLEDQVEGTARVVTTFLHDLRASETDMRSVSPSFQNLRSNLLVNEASATGRGVITFRNYIQAATVAFAHRESLGDLISAEGLAHITHAALTQFQAIAFPGKEDSRAHLARQYREDAEKALQSLADAEAHAGATEREVRESRAMLEAWEA
jgi:hypothetical protein